MNEICYVYMLVPMIEEKFHGQSPCVYFQPEGGLQVGFSLGMRLKETLARLRYPSKTLAPGAKQKPPAYHPIPYESPFMTVRL